MAHFADSWSAFDIDTVLNFYFFGVWFTTGPQRSIWSNILMNNHKLLAISARIQMTL